MSCATRVMNTFGICTSCRQRIRNRILCRISVRQWQTRATFVSLVPRTTTDEKQKAIPLSSGDKAAPKPGSRNSGNGNLRRPPKSAVRNEEKLLESLFEDSLKAPPAAGKLKTADMEMYDQVEALKAMLKDPTQPIDRTWVFFRSHFGPQVWSTNSAYLSKPSTFPITAKEVFQMLLSARQQVPVPANLPTVTEIASCFAALNLLRAQNWHAMMSTLLSPQPLNHDRHLAEDLLGTWRVAYELPSDRGRRTFGTDEWSFLPTIYPDGVARAMNSGGLAQVLQRFLPIFENIPPRTMASSALMTLALIKDLPHSFETHPFVGGIVKSLYLARANPTQIIELLGTQNVNILENLKVDVTSMALRVETIATRSNVIKRFTPSGDHIFETDAIFRKLSHALSNRDLWSVDDLWDQFKLSPSKTLQIYNKFIMVYMGLRQPDRAIDVWNYMIQSSINPTLMTWNAMLDGCKSARDPTSLEGVWVRLISSGLKPDIVCWTTRIGGLLDCGKTDLALDALKQMGRGWNQTARERKGTKLEHTADGDAAKPTIELINATISGLLRRNEGEAAQRVLAWGGTMGIKPDIITFNTLLRPLIKKNVAGSVQEFLKEMEAQGVQADVATFSIILDEALRRTVGLTIAEQIEIVDLTLADMEAAGVQANKQTYSAVINTLLEVYPNDITAAKTFLNKMLAKGLQPSVHVETMFVGYYFSRDPPDYEAIEGLLARVRSSNSPTDHIFWDRVIEGYARLKDSSSAVKILFEVDKEGLRVGWEALEWAVIALVENGERDLAKKIMRYVRNTRGDPIPRSTRGVDGQHNFWKTVVRLELLDV